jgi:hypothetical protein
MAEFENLRTSQWEKGASEYGEFAFVGLDFDKLVVMIGEELADVANYAMFMYVKLRFMEAELASRIDQPNTASAEDPEHTVPSGPGTFTPGPEVSGFLPKG